MRFLDVEEKTKRFYDYSFNLPLITKQQPILYELQETQSLMKLRNIQQKYDTQFSQFKKTQHKKTRTQLQKISRIIKDAQDLNQILEDADKWIKKNRYCQKKKKVTYK